jgi:hypothetical protein
MAPWKKRGEFRIVLVADALKETGRTAEELVAVYGVQELTVEKPNEGSQKALLVPSDLFVDTGNGA